MNRIRPKPDLISLFHQITPDHSIAHVLDLVYRYLPRWISFISCAKKRHLKVDENMGGWKSIKVLNIYTILLVGALGGLGGSILTILLVIASIGSLYLLVSARVMFVLSKTDMILVLAGLGFTLVQIIFGLMNYHQYQGAFAGFVRSAAPLLWFLTPCLLIPRFRSESFDILDKLVLGSGFCGILALPVAIFQVVVVGARASGGAGNSLPFALICVIFGLLSLFNILSVSLRRRCLGVLGFVAGASCLMLSGSIGLLPVMAIGTLVFGYVNRVSVFELCTPRVLIVFIGLLGGIFISAIPWFSRVEAALHYLSGSRQATGLETFTERTKLWSKGIDLFVNRPFLGYGLQNRAALIAETGSSYTHFHNGFLTVMVDSGVFGLLAVVGLCLAPVIVAWFAPVDELRAKRLMIAFFLTGTYFVGALSNILFMQDIYDSVFIWLSVCIAISVPVSATNPIRVYLKNRLEQPSQT